MHYLARDRAPPLDAFVVRLWYCADASQHARERVLPGGGVDLIINLVENQIRSYDPAHPDLARMHAGAVIRGPCTRSFLVDPRQRAAVIGAHFRPGAAFPLLGVSPSEFVDTLVPLEDVWRDGGRTVREQLLEAGSPSEQLQRLEAALLHKLGRARARHPAARAAVAALRASANEVRVGDLAKLVGLSHRGFVAIFEREVGLTPKLYSRLQRFHLAKQRIAALGGPPSWASFAVDCGYFDQSHMIRDFGAFAGMSPTGYLRSRNEETMFDHLVHGHHARTK